jgi:hypothetical protein
LALGGSNLLLQLDTRFARRFLGRSILSCRRFLGLPKAMLLVGP